jgi:hypothetical protein
MAGFKEIVMEFSSPIPEEHRLRKVDVEASNEKEKRVIAIYNDNIDRLNGALFGAQDYSIIGKK